jgi:hypothetical protein
MITIFGPINKKKFTFSFIFLAISIGLIIDQYLFLIFYEKTKLGYWDIISIIGMILLISILILYTGLILILKKTKIFFKLFMKKRKEDISNVSNIKDFSLLFICTILMILVARFYVLLYPNNSLILNGYEVHHLYTGVLIILFSIIPVIFIGHIYLNNKSRKLLLFIIGIATGLIIDEFFFLLSGGKTNNDYWNSISVNGVIFYFLFFSIFCILLHFLSQKNIKSIAKK